MRDSCLVCGSHQHLAGSCPRNRPFVPGEDWVLGAGEREPRGDLVLSLRGPSAAEIDDIVAGLARLGVAYSLNAGRDEVGRAAEVGHAAEAPVLPAQGDSGRGSPATAVPVVIHQAPQGQVLHLPPPEGWVADRDWRVEGCQGLAVSRRQCRKARRADSFFCNIGSHRWGGWA